MSEKNLPIKLIMQQESHVFPNLPGGSPKHFGEVTEDLKEEVINEFKDVLEYYSDFLDENPTIPVIGKVKMKNEAIAKSHKPTTLCKYCPIIGGEDLEENYIRITRESIQKTIEYIRTSDSKYLGANLTAITEISAFKPQEKLSTSLIMELKEDKFSRRVKLKCFDFGNDYDNQKILTYVEQTLNKLDLNYEYKDFGTNLKYFVLDVKEPQVVQQLSMINGIRKIDIFQKYYLPQQLQPIAVESIFNDNLDSILSDVVIGIIDGGISPNNTFLTPYIYARKEYVAPEYQNHHHGTFIASTIQFGNHLNNIPENGNIKFKFLDVVALPNNNPNHGPTDSLGEEELQEIILEVLEDFPEVKIWNLSLGLEQLVNNSKMSDLAIFLDEMQTRHNVQFFIASGNINDLSLQRTWPAIENDDEFDRMGSPADSVLGITVGSLALKDSPQSIVKKEEPSSFSRRGPGANYIIKPDVIDYGGNISNTGNISGLGIFGLDCNGNLTEDIGTSYATPRIVKKFASIYHELTERNLLMAKTMLMHSARLETRAIRKKEQHLMKYYGFGMPSNNVNDILKCSENEITLVFNQTIKRGRHLELIDFPYPPSLIRDGKYYGEIIMTLAYEPPLDSRYGSEYCRTNIDVSFGTYDILNDGKLDFKGEVPIDARWDQKFEQERVKNGFKWSPIKSFYRKMSKGIQEKDGWKLRINLTPRNDLDFVEQDFVLIVTIKTDEETDIYSEMVRELRQQGHITNNLETRQDIRARI